MVILCDVLKLLKCWLSADVLDAISGDFNKDFLQTYGRLPPEPEAKGSEGSPEISRGVSMTFMPMDQTCEQVLPQDGSESWKWMVSCWEGTFFTTYFI
jgi:hypothetical protein